MSLLPDWLTGFDPQNAEAAAAADKRLQELNAQTYGPFYTPKDTQAYGTGPGRDAVDQAFSDELDARAEGIFGTPLRVLGKVLSSTLFAIPMWVWLVAAGVAFWYLGGFTWLRGSLAKRKS